MIYMFPKVTYNFKEFCEYSHDNMEHSGTLACYHGYYSSYGKGCIWLREPSLKTFIHEFLHHIGYKLNLNIKWHFFVERIL